MWPAHHAGGELLADGVVEGGLEYSPGETFTTTGDGGHYMSIFCPHVQVSVPPGAISSILHVTLQVRGCIAHSANDSNFRGWEVTQPKLTHKTLVIYCIILTTISLTQSDRALHDHDILHVGLGLICLKVTQVFKVQGTRILNVKKD